MKQLALLCLVLFSCITFARQTKVDTLRTYHIEEITVTARRNTPMKEVIPVQSLSGINLEKLSAHSVADAIRYFSGTQIKDYGGVGGLKTVNIRSMGTNHVGVFYDGVQLGNAQNGTVDLGKFSLDNMESVTLYNGQKSAIFQSAKGFASSGSIYLQSKTPAFLGERDYNLGVTLKTGSFGTVNPSILFEQKLSKKIDGSVSAEYLYTTGRYKFRYKKEGGYDTTAVRKNGDVNAFRGEAGIYGKLKEGNWRLKAYIYHSERGYPGAVVKNVFDHGDRQWDTNFFVQGSYKQDFGKVYGTMINAKFSYDYLHYLNDPKRGNWAVMYTNNQYRQKEAYLSTANRFSIFSWWEANFSADFQFNTLDSDMNDFAYPQRYTTLTALATSFHLGGFKLQGNLLGTFVHDKVRSEKSVAAGHKSKYTPAVIASYRPWKETDFSMRAFYKKIFRMPTLNDLYYTSVGNANLKPEYTTQYNLGVTYGKEFGSTWLRHISIQADGYYNKVENKIVAIPKDNFFRWSMKNLGKVEIKGVDAGMHTYFRIGRKWGIDAQVNYTFQRAQDVTDPDAQYYGGQIPYIPRHSSSAILNVNYDGWELNYSFIYTGERYDSEANILENYHLPWYTSDLSVARVFKLKNTQWRATLEVNNLFNQQYEVVDNYPMPGTNFKLIVSMKL